MAGTVSNRQQRELEKQRKAEEQLTQELLGRSYADLSGATFTGAVSVPDDPYDAATWNGNTEVPTKNAVRDKIESLSSGGITALTGDVTASGSGSVPATLATAQPGAHTWALTQTFTLAPVFTDASGTRTALGGTTVGGNLFTLTNPSAVTFLRVNADNTVTARSAANFKTDLSLVSSDVGLGSVTNDAQTKAAIVPNTAPSAGQLLVGNAGGTAYAPVSASGDVTVSSTGAHTVSSTASVFRTAGSASAGAVAYSGTTQTSAKFDGSTTAPSHTTRLNYDGYFYATKFFGDGAGLTNLPSSTGGALTYVGTATVTGSASTTLAISGLDLATDGEYFLEIRLDNATASNANISIYNSADTTAGNYSRQSLLADSTAVSGARATDGIIGVLQASEGLALECIVKKDLDSKTRITSFGNYDQPSAIKLRLFAQIHNATTAVAGLTISSSVANSLAVGSYVNVYKRKP